MGCCKHGNTDGDCIECLRDEIAELLEEALQAMLNMAPRIRDERNGCFGDLQVDCTCTACKIRRIITPNAEVTGRPLADGTVDRKVWQHCAEKHTIEVDAYRDSDGAPTCCTDWAEARCRFVTTRKFGLVEVCSVTGLDLHRGPNEDGFLRPHDGCIVWPNAKVSGEE